MPDQSGLQRNNKERTKQAREKAFQAINSLKAEGKQVNFSSVAIRSGVSRRFLYQYQEVREMIEEQRSLEVDNNINKRAHFDKTAKSKDVVIAAKDKRIAKLEAENKQLRGEISILRGMIYEMKKSTSDTCN